MPQLTENHPKTRAQRGSDTDIPQLSCELCRERKVRCNKAIPDCTTCIKAGMVCVPVYRKRYSRGRHTASRNVGRSAKVERATAAVGAVPRQTGEDDLQDRVRRLECLISDIKHQQKDANDLFRDTLVSQTPQSSLLFGLDPTSPQNKRGNVSANTGYEFQRKRHVKDDFWTEMAKEIQGYRDMFGPDVTEEETAFIDPSTVTSTPSSLHSRADSILGLGYMAAHLSERYTTNPALVAQLCHVYNRQVDPIIKVMHRPTLNAYLVDGKGFLDYGLCDPRPAALRAAVCYAAVASMTEEQWQATFSCPKVKVLPDFRDACDVALKKAGLLTSMEMTVLQAFVLYLASLHQASEPLIDLEMDHYTLPRNINDTDFDVSFQAADIPDKDELTDMTLALVIYKAQLSGRLLKFRGMTTSITDKASPGQTAKILKDRLGQARHFEDQVRTLTATCDPESSAYAWFTFHVAESIISSMRLSALRPLNHTGLRDLHCFQGDKEALASALSVLSKAQLVRSDPRGDDFKWYFRIQWHTLAIAVAECFVCPNKQLLARAWPIVEAAYESSFHADHQPLGDDSEGSAANSDVQDVAQRQVLQTLMLRTREKVKKLLCGASDRGIITAPLVGNGRSGWHSTGSGTPADPFTLQSPSVISLTGIQEAAADTLALPTSLDFGFGLGLTPALTPSRSSPAWDNGALASPVHGLGELWSIIPTCSSSMADTNMDDGVDLEDNPDFSWQNWEDIMSGFEQRGSLFDSSVGLC